MWRLVIFIFATIAALNLAAPATAALVKGVVVYDKGCSSRLIIQTSLGYVLAEWYSGNSPSEGDSIVGELASYGFKDVYNLTADSSSHLWIDDFWLSKERVVEKLKDKCS